MPEEPAAPPGRRAPAGQDAPVVASSTDETPAPALVPVRTGLPWMLLGAGIGGAGAYLYQLLGARILGDEAYAPIGVLWTLHYLLITIVLYGIETFVTREVALRADRDRLPGGLRRTLVLLLAAAAPTAGALAWAGRSVLFPSTPVLAVVLAAMVISHGAFSIVRGLLAGSARFRGYGIVTGVESLTRLALAGVVAVALPTTAGFAWAIPAGGIIAASTWVMVRRAPLSAGEREVRARAHREATGAGGFLLVTGAANAAAQLLLAGGPLALAVMGATAQDISVLFVTITAARVPIVLAFGGVLSRALPAFTARREVGGVAALNAITIRIGVGAAILGVVAGGAGAAIGPWLIAALFGAEFTPSSLLAGGAGAMVLLASGGLLLNQVVIAQRAERRLLAPWYVGLAVAVMWIIAVDVAPIDRVIVGAVVGEAIALCGLVLVSLRRSR